jgi:hypothetical protein
MMIIGATVAKAIGTIPRKVRLKPVWVSTDGCTSAIAARSAIAKRAAGVSRRKRRRTTSGRELAMTIFSFFPQTEKMLEI